jgi:hypothetical protein
MPVAGIFSSAFMLSGFGLETVLDLVGSVWIQREFMTAAAILIMAAKL